MQIFSITAGITIEGDSISIILAVLNISTGVYVIAYLLVRRWIMKDIIHSPHLHENWCKTEYVSHKAKDGLQL